MMSRLLRAALRDAALPSRYERPRDHDRVYRVQPAARRGSRHSHR